MAPKVSDAHTAARREQILLAAMQCFANKGFHKTTVQDICKAAQLSPGAVYSYFESKNDIIEALARTGEEMNQNLFDLADSQKYASPQAMFSGALGLFLGQYKSPMFQTCLRMDAMFLAEALSNEQLANIGKRSYAKVRDRILQLVTKAQETSEVDPALDPAAVTQVLFSLVQGLGTQILMNADEEPNIGAYQEAVTAILNGAFFKTTDKQS